MIVRQSLEWPKLLKPHMSTLHFEAILEPKARHKRRQELIQVSPNGCGRAAAVIEDLDEQAMLSTVMAHHEALFADDYGAIVVEMLERVADGLDTLYEHGDQAVEERVWQEPVALVPSVVGVHETQQKILVLVGDIPDGSTRFHSGE